MRKTYFSGLATLGVAAILLIGCSEVPQAEIDLATKAVDEAKTAGAEVYAAEGFLAVQDSLKAALEGIEAKKSKFLPNYADNKEQLMSVQTLAGEIKVQAENRKEELKSEIQLTVADVKSLIEANKQLILEAPKGKEGTEALTQIQNELTTIETAVTESGTMLGQGEILASLDKAKAAKEKATAINTELQDVITKYKENLKGRKG